VEVEQRIPLKRALFYVLASVVIIWGLIVCAWLLHQKLLRVRQKDAHFKIVAIVQTSPQREKLKCWQLAELLNLSRNEPQNLYSFDPALAEKTLLSYPIFKKASCHRLRPGIVHVDYLLKEPIARLADFDNMSVDREGNLFPLSPYFTPKRLPEICVGLQEFSGWQQPLRCSEATLAFKIMGYIESNYPKNIRIVRIDTHAAHHPSAGSREVVLLLQDGILRYVRLKADDYEKSLYHYKALRDTFTSLQKEGKQQVIDLRCPSIALVSQVDQHL
jgi:hypothetical protein